MVRSFVHGVRLLRRNPGFAAVAVTTLALGIGANCAIFSVLDTVLLRRLPYPQADRLVQISSGNPGKGIAPGLVSVPDYFDWTNANPVFDRLAAWNFQFFNVAGRDAGGAEQAERVEGFQVTAGFFAIFGVRAQLGRMFFPEDEQLGRERAVILSDGFWRRRFGGDPGLIGRPLLVEGQPHTVVGVLPAGFRLFHVLNRELDLYVPYSLDAARASRTDRSLFVYGRLKNGVTLERAQAAMDAMSESIARRNPETSAGWRAQVVELQRQWTQPVRSLLLLAQAAVAFVLLMACVNIANLLLARGASRRKEMAIRIALGANRATLARQLLAESLAIGVLGGAAGCGLGFLLTGLLNRVPFSALNRVEPFRVDGLALAFGAAISLAAGLLAGLIPALEGSTRDLKPAGTGRSRVRQVLVFSEVALAALLLAGAGLLMRSGWRVVHMDRGVRSQGVLTAQVWLPPARYAGRAEIARFWRDTTERISTLPGVRSVSAVNFPPLSVLSTNVGVRVEGQAEAREGEEPRVLYWVAGPRYFETMGIPLAEGREFTEHDDDETRGVAMVSASMARRFWPGESAVGKRIRTAFPDARYYWLPRSTNPWLTVVGVVADVRLDGIAAQELPQMYLPYGQNPSSILHLVVRTAGNPTGLAAGLRRRVAELDNAQALSEVKTLDQVLAESVARPTWVMDLLLSAAAAALLLAALGVYGVTACAVEQRTREIGIRMALGARQGRVMWTVVAQTLVPVAAGVAAGLWASPVLTGTLRGMLVGIGVTDAASYLAAASGLLAVGVAAAWLPARRASRVDPASALREEYCV